MTDVIIIRHLPSNALACWLDSFLTGHINLSVALRHLHSPFQSVRTLLRRQDQFVTRAESMTSVYWCRRNDSSLVIEREGWSDRGVAWSPSGNYLATFHQQGIKLHGGRKWSLLRKFQHFGVEEIQFSPSETYVVARHLLLTVLFALFPWVLCWVPCHHRFKCLFVYDLCMYAR